MSEIQLVNVDGISETQEEPQGDAPPAKRGRGRPPGAKNKAKPAREPEELEHVPEEPEELEHAPGARTARSQNLLRHSLGKRP